MTNDPIGHSWSGKTYNGFSGQPVAEPPRPTRGGGKSDRKMLLAGGAGALALALAVGLWARPDFGDDGKAREPMKAVSAQAAAPSPPVPIEVAKLEPAPAPVSTGRMEVLPADMARAATQVERPAPPAVFRPPQRVIVPDPAPRAPAAADYAAQASVVAPPPRLAPRPVMNAGPSFNCRYARSRAEMMVCGDEDLARADRRLARAYNRAIAAGVPARELRADQDDWMSIREDAARHSPRAVASIYEQRITELSELADDDDY